jgi:hypothetical protein
MASNIEIKARSKDFANQKKLAEKLSGGTPQLLIQEDIFSRAAQGRLKLRILGPGEGELIAYLRPDQAIDLRDLQDHLSGKAPHHFKLGIASRVHCPKASIPLSYRPIQNPF